jgi:hypothetical protein
VGGGGGVQTGSIRHVGHFWPIVSDPGECEDEEFGGMKIGKRNRSTRRKAAPAPLRPPHILLDETGARTGTAAAGSQLLTATFVVVVICEFCSSFTFKSIYSLVNE